MGYDNRSRKKKGMGIALRMGVGIWLLGCTLFLALLACSGISLAVILNRVMGG